MKIETITTKVNVNGEVRTVSNEYPFPETLKEAASLEMFQDSEGKFDESKLLSALNSEIRRRYADRNRSSVQPPRTVKAIKEALAKGEISREEALALLGI